MKNVPDIKVGIVVGSTDWLPADVAIAQRGKLVDTYKAIYGEEGIYECSICITDNEVSIKRAIKDLYKAECTAVCLYFANYGPESTGTLMAQKLTCPVMLIGAAEEGDEPFMVNRLDAMSGFSNACYALKLRGTNIYVPDSPIGTLAQCAEMIHEFFAIARTLVAVKDLKVITIGPRPSSYLAAAAPNHLLYDLGIEVSEYSELELLNSYAKHEGDTRIAKVVSDMETELGESGNKHSSMLPKFAQYELTVEDWIRNHKGDRKYVTMTSTCWPAFPVNFGFVPCYKRYSIKMTTNAGHRLFEILFTEDKTVNRVGGGYRLKAAEKALDKFDDNMLLDIFFDFAHELFIYSNFREYNNEAEIHKKPIQNDQNKYIFSIKISGKKTLALSKIQTEKRDNPEIEE